MRHSPHRFSFTGGQKFLPSFSLSKSLYYFSLGCVSVKLLIPFERGYENLSTLICGYLLDPWRQK